MYGAILFDLDDTLVDFSRCEQAALRAGLAAIEHGLDLDGAWEEIYRAFTPHSRRHWQEWAQSGAPWTDVSPHVFGDFLRAHGLDPAQAGAAALAYQEHFGGSPVAHDGAVDAVRALRGRLPLGLISNGVGALQRTRLRSLGLDDCFDPLLISDEVGIRKPDRRIFDLAVERLGLPRRRILFVGDSIGDDLVGAADAGLAFCHFARRGGADYPPGYRPDHVVSGFDELIDVIVPS